MSPIIIFIIASLLLIILFAFLGVMTVNYAIFSWENQKVQDLTEKIKPTKENILNKRLSKNRKFNSVDIPKSSKQKAIKAAGRAYSKSKIALGKNDYPKWVKSVTKEASRFQNNTFQYSKNLVSHLISLTKPLEDIKQQEEKDQQKELTRELTKKLPTSDKSNSKGLLLASQSSRTRAETAKQDIQEAENISSEKDIESPLPDIEAQAEEATLGLVNSLKSPKTAEEMGLFEKRESKLLNKLQESGMADYDLWLDLGDLYAKFGEDKKAKEIYALVLKHSQDEKLKEKATNKLIGL